MEVESQLEEIAPRTELKYASKACVVFNSQAHSDKGEMTGAVEGNTLRVTRFRHRPDGRVNRMARDLRFAAGCVRRSLDVVIQGRRHVFNAAGQSKKGSQFWCK
jgi:hypothetical protein